MMTETTPSPLAFEPVPQTNTMNTGLTSALNFLSLPNACPFCIVALDPTTGRPIAVNSTFESIFGPLSTYKQWNFANAALEDVDPNAPSEDAGKETNRRKFRDAIDKVRASMCEDVDAWIQDAMAGKIKSSVKVRSVEMLTILRNEKGFLTRRHFDWTIGCVQNEEGVNGDRPASAIILYGEMLNEKEYNKAIAKADTFFMMEA